jgi:hypothetical protein
MRAVDARCDVLAGLVGSWHTGTMREVDRDAYEQHLLFCPPCLVQNDKARLAFAALPAAPNEPPPDDLVRRLADQLTELAGGA